MSISVKISQLNEGGSVASTDQLPVSRGGLDTLRIPANQFVVNASNIGVGSGQLYFDKSTGAGTTLQFRSLSGVDGLAVVNSGDTLVISASGQNPVKTSITGNGITTTFAVNGANSINANNYRVDIDGVLQEPLNDYTIVGSNIVFNPAPPAGSKVTVVSNNLVRAFDIIPSDGSVTNLKLADSSVTPQKLSVGGPYWDSSGRVGIGGITNPVSHLDVNGVGTFRAYGPNEGGEIQFLNSDNNSVGLHIDVVNYGNISTGRIYNGASNNTRLEFGQLVGTGGSVHFFTSGTERMSINGSGNVGIGTNNPQQALHVQGNVRVGDATLTQPSGSAPMFVCRAWVLFNGTRDTTGAVSTANTNRQILASGNVSSVTRVATGTYSVNFTTAMPDANFAAFATCSSVSSVARNLAAGVNTRTVNSVLAHIEDSDGVPVDQDTFSVCIFR